MKQVIKKKFENFLESSQTITILKDEVDTSKEKKICWTIKLNITWSKLKPVFQKKKCKLDCWFIKVYKKWNHPLFNKN